MQEPSEPVERGAEDSTVASQQPLAGGGAFTPPNASPIWSQLSGTQQCVTIVLGQSEVSFNRVLGWTEGSLIELEKVAGEPADILVNGTLCARGEVVTVDENFGVRITEIIQAP